MPGILKNRFGTWNRKGEGDQFTWLRQATIFLTLSRIIFFKTEIFNIQFDNIRKRGIQKNSVLKQWVKLNTKIVTCASSEFVVRPAAINLTPRASFYLQYLLLSCELCYACYLIILSCCLVLSYSYSKWSRNLEP